MKRNVLMDGNGSDTVMIEGLGMYVPVSQVRSMQAEVERLRDRIGAQNNHISEINSRLQIPEDANGDLEQERDQLKALREGELHHNDDVVAAMFSMAMREKLAKKRADGRGGWDDKDICTEGFLNKMLCGHIEKGDPVDVANFAMMLWYRNEKTSIAAHDAKVIERETQRCIEAVEAEPEYPDEAPPELMKYINQCIENKDADHMLHMMRHSVRLTKSEIINRIRGLETQQAKAQPGNDSCELECGAHGTYCRCRAEKAKEVQS